MLDLYKHYAKSGIYEFVTDVEFTGRIKKKKEKKECAHELIRKTKNLIK